MKQIGKFERTEIGTKISAFAMSVMMVLAIFAAVPFASAASGETYTVNADFDKGILANVEHDTVPDQLQLSKNLVSLPLIWVPNSNEGTISKVNTTNGNEIGRFLTGPTTAGSPSRTTVDLMGNVWFGNRNTGTVVKVGLVENGQCKDKNGNGIIETSQDTNNDGNVTGAEVLPWGTDECVLLVIPGIAGARGLAVDANNNLWAGGWGISQYKYIDGETGAVLKTVATNPAYGAVVDANNILWSSEWSTPNVGKLDPAVPSYTSIALPETGGVYGVGIDGENNLLISGYFNSSVSMYNISTGFPVWKWTTKDANLSQARGIVATRDGDIWVAASGSGKVIRLSSDGVIKAKISVGNFPTGVAVDNEDKVWVVNYYDGFIKQIDPATNTISLEKLILGSSGTGFAGHYGYSDMTGYVSRTITTKTGTWTVDFDSENAGTPWGTVLWNSSEPVGTLVSARVRSSDDKVTWSAWEDAINSAKLLSTPNGRYLQIETTLQIASGDVSPILYDLIVRVDNQPPTAEAGGPYTTDEGSPVVLNASGSSDPDGDPLNYAWDLDNDSVFETPGMTATLTPLDGPATIEVGLQVTDGKGGVATDTVKINVNNVAPVVCPVIVPIEPQPVNKSINVSALFTDAGILDTHITGINYGDGTITPGTVSETDGSGSANGSHIYTAAGLYRVKVNVTDKDGGAGTATAELYVVIYDPNGGFVTGGGWINSLAGSYVADPTLSGKANFGFVSKYQKGATKPSGNTEFQFHAGDLNFHSNIYEWLVIAGAKAQYKGNGTINGAGDYGFMLTAIDSAINGGGNADKFRFKIWDVAANITVYDNQLGAIDSADPTTVIQGGNIVIHKGK